MRVTYLVPKWNNLGDKIIFLGARHLLRRRYPDHLHTVCLYPWEDGLSETDILVVCGTPWVWDQCGQSRKYQALQRALQRAPKAYKIGLGLGSCYPLRTSLDDAVGSAKAVSGLWGDFDELEVRDQFAYEVFTRCGLKCKLSPCPAWYACESVQVRANPTRPLIIPIDVHHCVASPGLSAEDRANLSWQFRTWFRLVPNAKVVTISRADAQYVEKLGRKAEVIHQEDNESDEEDTVTRLLETVAQSTYLITSRVHAAIPAMSLGIPTTIIPIDTRALTCLVGTTNSPPA